MSELNKSILEHSGRVDVNNLKAILDDFDITKDISQEHFITSNYYDLEGSIRILSSKKKTNLLFSVSTLNAYPQSLIL